jgi:hypothetical protein
MTDRVKVRVTKERKVMSPKIFGIAGLPKSKQKDPLGVAPPISNPGFNFNKIKN